MVVLVEAALAGLLLLFARHGSSNTGGGARGGEEDTRNSKSEVTNDNTAQRPDRRRAATTSRVLRGMAMPTCPCASPWRCAPLLGFWQQQQWTWRRFVRRKKPPNGRPCSKQCFAGAATNDGGGHGQPRPSAILTGPQRAVPGMQYTISTVLLSQFLLVFWFYRYLYTLVPVLEYVHVA
jgi:hypothetical protein